MKPHELFTRLKKNEKNPRTINKQQLEKLKKSITSFSKMLTIRPIVYDENYIVLGGNMRLFVLEELIRDGFELKESYFSQVLDLTEDEKREFTIKDNIAYGDWNYDVLANEWDSEQLEEWGLPISAMLSIDDFNKKNKEIDVEELAKNLDIECPKCHFRFEKK